MEEWYQRTADHIIINCKVIPSASRNGFGGIRNGDLVVRLNAPPEKGKANKELLRFIAKTLGISRNAVSLISGAASRSKRVSVSGTVQTEALLKLPD